MGLPLSSEESSDAAKGDENGESEPSGSGDSGFRGLSLPPDVSKKVSDESLSIPDSLSDLEDPPSNSEELLHDTSAGSKGLSGLDHGLMHSWDKPDRDKPGWYDDMKKSYKSDEKAYRGEGKSHHSPKNKKHHSRKRLDKVSKPKKSLNTYKPPSYGLNKPGWNTPGWNTPGWKNWNGPKPKETTTIKIPLPRNYKDEVESKLPLGESYPLSSKEGSSEDYPSVDKTSESLTHTRIHINLEKTLIKVINK